MIREPQNLNEVARDEIAALEVNVQAEEMRKALPKAIGKEQIAKATEILKKYKEGKSNLEKKIINNEQYWKLRQWDRKYDKNDDYKPTTAWLWSCIQSRYSDAMDSYPTCNFLARQEDDKPEAKKLSAIVPIILEQNHYEETYSDISWYLLKHGGCVQGVFWDKGKNNGLGDVEIKKIDLLKLFWEPGVTDIQDSTNLFCVELVNKKTIEEQFPQAVGHLTSDDVNPSHYIYDDSIDTTDKAVVIDWYYHKWINGRKTLQYVKYVNDVVLYATENDTEVPTNKAVDPDTNIPVVIPTGKPSMAERGLYDHGQYPFVFSSLYPIEGSLCGYGLTDIGKDTQTEIDVLHKAIVENAVVNSAPRYFSKEGNGINEKEFLDKDKPIVHVAGNLQDNLLPITSNTLSGIYVDVMQHLIDTLKYVTSNQDVGNGVAPSGITAASAIAALQETQGKNARSSNRVQYRGFREVVYQIVELVRQFYDLPRTFRIAPDVMENNAEEYINYTNEHLIPQPQMVNGENVGFRTPEFDIEVTAEKSSPYKKMEQNELALNFYAQGIFNPDMSDQALACLKMMDFPHKEDVINQVNTNGTLKDMVLHFEELSLQLAMQTGDAQMINEISQAIEMANQKVMPKTISGDQIGTISESQEASHVTRAREQARGSTAIE